MLSRRFRLRECQRLCKVKTDLWDGIHRRVTNRVNGYEIQIAEHDGDIWMIGFKLEKDDSANPYLTMTGVGVWKTVRLITHGIIAAMKAAHSMNPRANFYVRGEDEKRLRVWRRFFTREAVNRALKA